MFARSRLTAALVLVGLVLAVACAPAAPAQKPAESKPAAQAQKPAESKPAEAKPAAGQAKPAAGGMELKFSVFHTETDAFAETEKWWAQQVAERTQGRVTITPFYAGSLATATETLNAVRDGSADLGIAAASVLSGQVPAMSNFEPVGAYPADPEKWNATMARVRPLLKQIMAGANTEYLWGQPGTGLVTNCKSKHLKTPADWQGMKVRAAGRWQSEQVQALGASPIATDPGEVYLALQGGTVDCALFVNNLTLSFKLHEPAPYMTQLRTTVNLSSVIANRDVWNRISEADRATIEEISVEATNRSMPYLIGFQDNAVKELEQAGAQHYFLTDEELRQFITAVSPVYDRVAEQGGELSAQLGQALKEMRGS